MRPASRSHLCIVCSQRAPPVEHGEQHQEAGVISVSVPFRGQHTAHPR